MKIAFLIAGTKGLNFFRSFHEKATVEQVVSYASQGLQHEPHSEIKEICRSRNYRYSDRSALTSGLLADAALVFVAGWQWMLPQIDDRFVIFHDSLLPQYRGFNPSVTALITGERILGVTAFRPDVQADAGPIYGQERIEIEYPITIREVYTRVGRAYAALAQGIVDRAMVGKLASRPQSHAQASYSLWRDDDDYEIDWNQLADRIERFVHAVGWPYLGARTTLGGRLIRVTRVRLAQDIFLPLRQPGKIWSRHDEGPIVVCGSGTLQILEALEEDGTKVEFDQLRVRLGR
jgi:methionyl-tRNA formyltransferase